MQLSLQISSIGSQVAIAAMDYKQKTSDMIMVYLMVSVFDFIDTVDQNWKYGQWE